MPLPVHASIHAAQSFVRNVRAAEEFLHEQDSERADARYDALLGRLAQARERLRWNPAAGRPARFARKHAPQAQAALARIHVLARSHGLLHFRELVLKPYVLLYAHSENRVLLLALRHERQLFFDVGDAH